MSAVANAAIHCSNCESVSGGTQIQMSEDKQLSQFYSSRKSTCENLLHRFHENVSPHAPALKYIFLQVHLSVEHTIQAELGTNKLGATR